MIRINSRPVDRIGTPSLPNRFEVSDVLRDSAALGLTADLRAALNAEAPGDSRAALRAVRDLVYELAGSGSPKGTRLTLYSRQERSSALLGT